MPVFFFKSLSAWILHRMERIVLAGIWQLRDSSDRYCMRAEVVLQKNSSDVKFMGKLTLKQLLLLKLVDFSAVFYMLSPLLKPWGAIRIQII
jgi:hypothetical protein